MSEPILQVRDLSTLFTTRNGNALAVDKVSFDLKAGETLCVVGESGCGKSITALSIAGLVPYPGKVVGGEVMLGGIDLRRMTAAETSRIRGNRLSMIFQDPSSALNPVHTVGKQIAEVYRLHKGMTEAEAKAAAIKLLAAVGIPDPERRMKAYPHEMSGGMAQRIMIAMALACQPEVLIADEPTTALDVTIQAQILELMRELQKDFGTAIILITHDLGVVAEMADHVAVMYAGQVVEYADVRTLFRSPQHPYTKALLRSIPSMDAGQEMLEVIEGRVPQLTHLPQGCRFAPRCTARREVDEPRCTSLVPDLLPVAPDHHSRCWLTASSATEMHKQAELL
ncbi:ABC transporter ATP-binding protein [Devosia sp. MC521]|uniref:ABC transporter ATP-binding protein n=1 Tax=Devosia sp. MC521 TaxID=2759954 RepID=UPI0015FBA82B|nr:ABC transporter ATP-binding protein [Devosia sp. MC521]MBJ6986437.1 ABC transporter ATP-binding protein [Devosia sp. MC521]QMW64093.1 ABC transporter ATP-binding protein [Devosia sp. MC521]